MNAIGFLGLHDTLPRTRKAEQYAAGYLLRKLQTIRHAKCPGSPKTSTIQNANQLDIAAQDERE